MTSGLLTHPTNDAINDGTLHKTSSRRPEAIICLTSALAFHFDRDTFTLRRTEIQIRGTDQLIGLFSADRSIGEAVRIRGHVGYEIGQDTLEEWLLRGGKPSRLIELTAQLPPSQAATPAGPSGHGVTKDENESAALSRGESVLKVTRVTAAPGRICSENLLQMSIRRHRAAL